ncbi:MAG: aldo/keto reductase family protein [Deltaproteobacteria bacterium]|nr:aldo/keto reductase family protein [Deltaproteobacteria bacterium]
MEHRPLGRSGLRVSEIALGSWLTFGASVDVPGTVEVVHAALDAGIVFFDTADVYAGGAAEEALREALRGLPRHKLVLASKAFFPLSEDPNDRGLSRKHLFESVHASLRRLGTDYLDLHQCHRFDPTVPVDETVRAYEDLIRQGKVLYWGTSEWRAEQITAALAAADRHGAYRPISNQPQYSLLRRGIEAKVLPLCAREGIGQVVWSPLAQGVLTGKYRPGERPAGTRAAHPSQARFMEAFLGEEVLARVEGLRPIAGDLGLTMAQLALAWCLRQEGIASVIVGATRPAQLAETAKASGVKLPSDAVAALDRLFAAA